MTVRPAASGLAASFPARTIELESTSLCDSILAGSVAWSVPYRACPLSPPRRLTTSRPGRPCRCGASSPAPARAGGDRSDDWARRGSVWFASGRDRVGNRVCRARGVGGCPFPKRGLGGRLALGGRRRSRSRLSPRTPTLVRPRQHRHVRIGCAHAGAASGHARGRTGRRASAAAQSARCRAAGRSRRAPSSKSPASRRETGGQRHRERLA